MTLRWCHVPISVVFKRIDSYHSVAMANFASSLMPRMVILSNVMHYMYDLFDGVVVAVTLGFEEGRLLRQTERAELA